MEGEENSTWSSANESVSESERASWPAWKRHLAAVGPVIPIVIVACIMLAMGCSITLKDVWTHLRRPVGVAIGATSQFVLFPLASFGLAHALQLPAAQALGFLILACSPGGTASNIYTYYVDGDVALSICMTTVATVLALGMMPLNLFIYSRSWTSDMVHVPYKKIAVSLAGVLVPLAVGMLIHWKLKKIAKVITKVGAVLGMALIVVISVFKAILYPHVFTSYWQVWVVAVLFPYTGFFLGYIFAFACRRTLVQCRTIAMEPGIQNVGVTYTVIAISYRGSFAAEVSIIPVLAGFSVTLGGLSAILAFRLYAHFHKEKTADLKEEAELELGANDPSPTPTPTHTEK